MADVLARGARFHVQRIAETTEGAHADVAVFLHGLVMDNLSSWYFTVANAAAQACDVLLYDLRGHGKSERPASGYTLDDMVLDLAGVLDAVEPGRRVHLVGNSFGGLLALAFARAYPARVGSLALVDAHLGDAGFGEEMAATLGLKGEERDKKIADSFKEWLGRHSERKRNRLADLAKNLVGETSLVADMRGTAPLAGADFAAIDAPVLALYGERSDLRARGEACLAAIRSKRIVVLPGCTHSVLWEETARVRELIVDFLREHAR